LNTLPLSFGYGLSQLLTAFFFGGKMVLEKSFAYPIKIMERMVKERATGFPLVPTMMALMFQLRDLAKLDLSGLRYVTNAAAPLPVSHIKKFRKMFPTVELYSMYGLTECLRVSYLSPEYLDLKPESVGVPMPGVKVAIVNKNGEALGSGEIGELVVTGPNVMQGYWNDPETTARAFRSANTNGQVQLYTGDLFKKDDDGFLYFVSRKDDLIKIKGEKVSPKEIENVLCKMDGVLEAAVIGIVDELLGRAIKAFVVPANGCHMTETQVFRHCRQNLEPFMIPKYVSIRTSLPKSASGKIDKKRLS
jgi:acyl-CoA synthetase (AMP-forming)/AMP-acid ligase II